MKSRCLKILVAGLAIVLAAPLMMATAQAQTIDGDLADLKAAVLGNLNTAGLRLIDECGDIGSTGCGYFPNGADIDTGWVYVDVSASGGALWVGFEQCGTIGDADGDNNPDTFTNTEGPGGVCPPVSGDDPGIGPEEQYLIQIDTDCGTSFLPNLVFAVADNNVFQKQGLTFTPIPGAEFNAPTTGKQELEIWIPNFASYLAAAGGDLCNFTVNVRGGFLNDGLAEDDSPVGQIFIPADVSVEKNPPEQSACAGTDVSWTLTACNEGACTLDSLYVTDVLDEGLSYVTDSQGGQVNGQVITWIFTDVAPGQCIEIDLTASLPNECLSSAYQDSVHVLGVKRSDCLDQPDVTEDWDTAIVNCLNPDVTIDKSVSEEVILPTETTTVTLLVSNTGSSILDPVTVTDQIDDGATFDDTQTIGGSCGASVVSFVNGLITFSDFSLGVGESCMITYEVGCSETSVELPDTAKVVAYCQGTFPDNPVEDEDYASFTCSCPPDVRIEKDVTPELINAGEVATVTLRIYNDGTTTLDPIDVCDKLDSGVGFDETQTIGGTCGVGLSSTTPNADGSLTICFDSFSLLSGESCSITYEVTCVETGEHPDTATVVAHCQGGLPTDIDEDEAYASFRCACPPDVELSKRIEPNTISDFDDRATVTLTVMNVGDTELDPVEVCDKIENGVGFDETQTIQGSCGVGIDDITTNADGSFTVCFEPFSLGVGESCTIIYEIYCIETGTHPDTATVIAKCKGGEPEDVDEDMAVAVLDCRPRELCWMTAGGHNSGGDDAGKKYWNWGGNVGPPPSGEWQHWERTYDDGDLVNYQEINFHAHDVNIDYCEQIDPGPCHPSAPVNTIHFFGTGTYNLGKGKKEYDAEFVARVEDHNEPGNTGHEDQGCDPGEPDVYYIKVWKAGTDPSDPANVVIEHTELIDGGNLQIHELKENQIRDDRVGRTDLGTTGSGDAFEGDGMDIGRLQLYSPTPNPFNHDTRIAYAVAGTGEPVEIGIYNVAGRLVRKLVSGQQTPGYHEVTWDARSDSGVQVAPGVYFLRAIVGSERISGSRILYMR